MSVHVTDHALLRYLERVQGIDVEAIRADLAGRAERVAVTLSAMPRPLRYRVMFLDFALVVRDDRVVTVIADPPARARHCAGRAARLAAEEG